MLNPRSEAHVSALAAPLLALPQTCGQWLRTRLSPRTGDLLLREGLITPVQLERALAWQVESRQPLGAAVVSLGLAEASHVLAVLNRHHRIRAESLTDDIPGLIDSRRAARRALGWMRMHLGLKLSLVVAGILWVAVVVLCLVMLAHQQTWITAQARETTRLRMGLLAEQARPAVLRYDGKAASKAVAAAAERPLVAYSAVTDARGRLLAQAGSAAVGPLLPLPERGNAPEQRLTLPDGAEVLLMSQPIRAAGKTVGHAHVALALDYVAAQMRQEALLLIGLSTLIVALGVALAWTQGGRLLRTLAALLAVTPMTRGTDQDYRIHIRAGHEFEDLTTNFDHLSRELAHKLHLEESVQRYVNPAVLAHIRDSPDDPWMKGQLSEATVLFTDVRGFTALAESREPEAVVEALNEYFAIANRAIVAEGGYVDKFIGDGVLGVFGVPFARDDHVLCAVKAAVEMQRQLRRQGRRSLNPMLMRVGIGVNNGTLVSGNIGSTERMEYTVIGDCVNVAARLNTLAEPGEVIVSDHVAAQLPSHLVTLSELPPVSVKGKQEPLHAQKVLKINF